MAPFVNLRVDVQRLEALRALGDDDLCPAFIHVFNDPVRIKRLVGDETTELDTRNERGQADGIVVLSGQQNEANQIAERVRQGQDFGAQTAP